MTKSDFLFKKPSFSIEFCKYTADTKAQNAQDGLLLSRCTTSMASSATAKVAILSESRDSASKLQQNTSQPQLELQKPLNLPESHGTTLKVFFRTSSAAMYVPYVVSAWGV